MRLVLMCLNTNTEIYFDGYCDDFFKRFFEGNCESYWESLP